MRAFLERNGLFTFIFLFLLTVGTPIVYFNIDTYVAHTSCRGVDFYREQCRNQIDDVIRYFGYARDTKEPFAVFQSIADSIRGTHSARNKSMFTGLGVTNTFIIPMIALCMRISPSAPYVVAYLLQLLTLPYFFWCLKRLARFVPPDFHNLYYAACVLSPFVLVSLSVPGKEYLSILCVTAMAVHSLQKQRLLVLILAIVGATVREVNLLIGFAFIALTFKRVKLWHILALAGLAIPVANLILPSFRTFRETWSILTNQNSANLLVPLAKIQGYPFGHLVAAPVIFAMNVLGPGFGPTTIGSLFGGFIGLYLLSAILASYIFVAFGIQALIVCWRRKLWSHPLVHMVVCIILCTSVLPLNQLRYYYPIWPFVLALALMIPGRSEARLDEPTPA